jgi:hypothetical protein
VGQPDAHVDSRGIRSAADVSGDELSNDADEANNTDADQRVAAGLRNHGAEACGDPHAGEPLDVRPKVCLCVPLISTAPVHRVLHHVTGG